LANSKTAKNCKQNKPNKTKLPKATIRQIQFAQENCGNPNESVKG